MLRRAVSRVPHLDRRSRAALVLITIFALGVIAAAWLIAADIAHRERERVMHDARAELIGAQQAMAAHVSRTFEAAQTLLAAAELWLADYPAAGDRSFDELAKILERIQSLHEQPLHLRLIDPFGKFFQFGDLTSESADVQDREYFQTLSASAYGTIHIGLPITSRLNGSTIIPVGMRARPNALGVAILAVGVPTRQFIDAYRTLLIMAPSSSGIVNKDGFVLLRDPDPEGLTGKRLPTYVANAFLTDRPASGITANYRSASGDEMLVSYAALRRQSLVIYCAFRLADLASRWETRGRSAYGGAGLAMLLTLLGAVSLAGLVMKSANEAARVAAALRAAEDANRAKSDFLARMSHELRTPLNAIIGFSETIKRSLLGPLPSKYQVYGADIHRSGQHLLALIDDVLDMSRVESGTAAQVDETVELGEAVDDAVKLVEAKFAAQGMKFSRRVPTDLPPLLADRRMLRQIFLNLLSNAARYAGPETTVELSAALTGGDIVVVVSDNGAGIPQATLAHIFEPFGRGGADVTRRDGGIGLGLPITRSLMALHGGSISIDSRVGAGTSVTLRFPASRVLQSSARLAGE